MLKPCASHLHSRFLGQTPRNARKHCAVKTKHSSVVLASLTNKGKQFSAESIVVNKIMGEGSYGQVFEVNTVPALRSVHQQHTRYTDYTLDHSGSSEPRLRD